MAATTNYFITEAFLISNGIVYNNVDAHYAGLIQFAAKAFVKPQIGSYFFEDLLTKYNNQTLSTDEQTLVEKMQWAIAWRVKADIGIEMTYQLTNNGYLKQADDNAQVIDLKEVSFLTDRALQKAILFESELKDYLVDNKNLYSVYLDILNKDSMIKNNEFNYGGTNLNDGVGMIII